MVISKIRALRRLTAKNIDRIRRGGLYRAPKSGLGVQDHLREAVEWLVRAQDAGDNRGVSYGVDFGGPFLERYPETTGYIIPTFLALADYYGDESFSSRAVEMGEGASEVQMDSGAVMGGFLNSQPTPAVFNTGMVLLGWSALYERFQSAEFLHSLQEASNWLISMQESDGNWIKGNSKYANPDATVYNVKAAWGLCEAGHVADMPGALEAASLNAEYCISKQLANGWFRDCCLIDQAQPLLHTIAYSMQGLLGIGTIVHRDDFVEAAALTADSLVKLMDDDGFIPGRIDADFNGTVDWCCMTGTAQTAIVWGKLFQITGKPTYREAMLRANEYLMRRHDIENDDARLRGGIPGSWPVWGSYGRLLILNWATNFFVESLLLQESIERDIPEARICAS
jgi:hypothetical protein